jgi:hypothetical protein
MIQLNAKDRPFDVRSDERSDCSDPINFRGKANSQPNDPVRTDESPPFVSPPPAPWPRVFPQL